MNRRQDKCLFHSIKHIDALSKSIYHKFSRSLSLYLLHGVRKRKIIVLLSYISCNITNGNPSAPSIIYVINIFLLLFCLSLFFMFYTSDRHCYLMITCVFSLIWFHIFIRLCLPDCLYSWEHEEKNANAYRRLNVRRIKTACLLHS